MTVMKNHFTNLQSGLSVLVCFLVALGGAKCNRVQFFQNTNYSGFLTEYEVPDYQCVYVQFSRPFQAVLSMKTDRCLMVYEVRDCPWYFKTIGYSFRLEKDEPNLLSSFPYLRKSALVGSVAVCEQLSKASDPTAPTVIFKDKPYFSGESHVYREVCGCRNIRVSNKWGKTNQISVENFGLSFEMFEGEHCTGKSKVLPAGYSMESFNLWLGNDFDIRSFRYTNLDKCLKMDASISNFEFGSTKPTEVDLGKFMESAQLATSAKMRNSKATKLTQEYSISEKVTNTLDLTLSTSLTKMHKVGFTTDFKVTMNVGFPLLMQGKVGFHAGLNYAHSWANSLTNTTKKIVTDEETVSTRQVIEVPSCKECVATSSINKVKGYPIPYTAYIRINASDLKRRLEGRELKRILPPGMTFVYDYDEYTVEVMSEGIMTANFALNAVINVECVPIPGCKTSTPDKPSTSAFCLWGLLC